MSCILKLIFWPFFSLIHIHTHTAVTKAYMGGRDCYIIQKNSLLYNFYFYFLKRWQFKWIWQEDFELPSVTVGVFESRHKIILY